MAKLILASASSRRRELLEQIGLEPTLCPVDIDESVGVDERPVEYVKRLSYQKASAAREKIQTENIYGFKESYLLASDTTVVVNDLICGKPRDKEDFIRIMKQLSGSVHSVLTAVTILKLDEYTLVDHLTFCETTEVCFREISSTEMDAYWKTKEPADKAGGYGIQGRGAVFVDSISGSYSNVVGLPLSQTYMALKGLGFPFK